MSDILDETDLGATGQARFKQGMRWLVGTVNIIAQQGLSGTLLGVTATAVCSLSAEPPSLIACVNRQSQLAAELEKGARFSVSVLAEDQEAIAQAFGGRSGVSGRARFAYGEWYRSEHDVPLLAGSRACFECRVADYMDYGSHRAAIGVVTDVHIAETHAKCLVFANGQYFTVG